MKTVLVLGVRSGTSMVSGMLARLGVFMGDVWLGPNVYNPKGYFEDAHFLSLVNRIHTSISGSKMLPVILKDPSVVSSELHQEFEDEVRRHQRDVWGFKAPSACYLLRFIERYVESPHYIVCYRDPIEIASSSARVLEHTVPKWFPWYEYAKDFMDTCLSETESAKRLVVDYGTVLKDPESRVGDIINFLGISPTEDQTKDAVSFVDPSLRHNEV